MKLTRRLLSVLLAMAMVLAMAPAGMAAEETPAEPEPVATLPEEAETEDAQADAVGSTIPVIGETLALEPWVNPLYADVLDVSDLPEYEAPEKPDASVQATFVNQDAAAKTVRNYMKSRTENFTFYVYAETTDYNDLLDQVLDAAMAHTGVPTEGDYLLWHLKGLTGGSVGWEPSGSGYNYTFTITLEYYTTAAQEAEMNTAVSTLLSQLNLRYKTDYEKIRGVYDYICDNVTYDYDNLADDSYTLKFSAYAALVNKTAVCQGYAQLFYRLMLELGVDCRVIAGIAGDDISGYGGHAWNIVELDGLYYNVDSTWDAGYDEYLWLLNNTWNFVGHSRYVEYETMEFHTAYPMAAEDYDPSVPGEMDPYICGGYCGDNAVWLMGRNGELVIFGEGPMYHFAPSGDNIPLWIYLWSDYISTVTVDEGITSTGNYSFCSLPNLTEVVLPDSLMEIGAYSFEYCKGASFSELPKNLTTIGDCAFAQCNVLTEVTIPASVEYLGFNAFQSCAGLKTVILENSGAVGAYAFSGCHALEELIISGNITRINSAAFQNCTALKEVTFPESIKQLDPSSFAGCTALSVITFLGDAPSIQPYTFEGVTATAYYPANSTWTESVRQDYMGNITWVSTCGHEYESVVTAPTCTAQGYTTYTCTLCGHSYTDSYTEMAPHTPGEAVSENIVNPTCTAKGSYERVTYCADCGAELERETVETDMLPHAYESVVTEPTCTAGGWTTHTCVDCGDSYEDSYTEPLGHDMGPWVLIQAATCTAGGWEESTCSRCDHSETRETALAEHSYEAVVTAPTCTTRGYTTHTCAVCGDSYEDSYTDALGHDCTYSVTTVPTEFKAGALTGTCAVCGHEESVELPAISEEDYEITVLQAPTDSEPGAAECVWKNTQYGEIRFEAELRPLAVPGDVNGDGEIDILDANLVVAWYNEIRDLTDKQLAAADVNGDGEVDIMDANMIVAYYNEIIDEFPAAKA